MSVFGRAFSVELLKARRSKVPLLTAAAISLGPIVGADAHSHAAAGLLGRSSVLASLLLRQGVVPVMPVRQRWPPRVVNDRFDCGDLRGATPAG